MEKLGVLIDPEKRKKSDPKEKTASANEVNVPWDPEKGTEPFEATVPPEED